MVYVDIICGNDIPSMVGMLVFLLAGLNKTF